MIARGALGNPWIFEELTGAATAPPTPTRSSTSCSWTMDRAEEHLGPERRSALRCASSIPGTWSAWVPRARMPTPSSAPRASTRREMLASLEPGRRCLVAIRPPACGAARRGLLQRARVIASL